MKLAGSFALLLFALFAAGAQTSVGVHIPVPDEAELRRQAFEKVWNTVNEQHYDPTYGGVDWEKVREIYAPKAAAAGTRDDFHAVLRRMLGELKLSHFGIYPRDMDGAQSAATSGTIGAGVKMMGVQPVIARIDAGSAAAAAGLRPGYVVRKVDSRTIAQILRPVEQGFAGRNLTPGSKQIYRESSILSRMSGAPGTSVKVEVLDDKDRVRTFDIKRRPFAGEVSPAMGNFPPQEVVFESKMLASGIAYLRFNLWVIPQAPKIRQAVREFAGAKGMIIDLRGNPGGVGGLASGVAGLLVDESISLGSMNMRDSVQKFIAYPQANAFLGKVVILTDHGTASTSEVFASGMQEAGRATIVGETSAGAVLPSVFDTLETGVIFQYAISDYRSPKNVLIEGRGVLPDLKVVQTRDALIKGRDLPLEAAEKLILTN